ncbi:MAG: response regulator [Candidatus Riflebacteria bacterium]|nr:response regulator [Candidatus Riflebacteria bacterium]
MTSPQGKVPAPADFLILLAEDEPAIRETLELFLVEAGYRVVAVGDGGAALQRLTEDPRAFAVLVTDIRMPVLDGASLAKRSRGLNPGLKIIFISGFPGDVANLPDLCAAGARFLAKPFPMGDLLNAVSEALAMGPGPAGNG